MRIVFMGTPEFAIPSLAALLHSKHEVLAVVTAPDAKGGRGGQQLIQSEVKQFALSHGLLVLQPEKLRSKDFMDQLKSLNPDLQIIVAFRMLPEVVWSMPRLGTINVHGSLLPKYRGAAPIHWAVLNGETRTGVTIFRLKHEIDTGDIIQQATTEIGADETSGEVYDRLKLLGATTLMESLEKIESGGLTLIAQDTSMVNPAPKLFHHQAGLNFSKTNLEIHNFIRGFSPQPTAWMFFQELKFLLYRSHIPNIQPPRGEAGRLQIIGRKLYLHTIDGSLEILELQQEGKKRMPARDFINGMRNHPAFK